MIFVLTAEDVRRQDAQAVEHGTTVAQLMENAGWAVARVAREMMGGTYGRRVVIVCGTGNNAGDGLVAGRILQEQGAHCTAILTSDELNGLASAQLAVFKGRVAHLDELSRELERADLVIDAIFGVGLNRAPDGEQAEAIAECTRGDVPILAIDVPSGFDADTGQAPGFAMDADVTVTFGGWKPGLLFGLCASHAGIVIVQDIGAGELPFQTTYTLEAADVRSLMPWRETLTNKRRAGSVLVVAGSRAMPGAAVLATGAAVHAGAGLTMLCAPESVCAAAVARTPEIVTIPSPETGDGTIDAKALDVILPRLTDVHAVAIGPGLSTNPSTVELVRGLVAAVEDRATVIDADGLNAFVGASELLRGDHVVITPHAGELSRLTGIPVEGLEADRLGMARRIAEDLGVTLVFKGPGTVTASFETYVNTTGGPALAQGGTGDVLCGLLASFMAQARSADAELVAAGVWLHGLAADRIAARLDPHPANASALIEELGPTMHAVINGD